MEFCVGFFALQQYIFSPTKLWTLYAFLIKISVQLRRNRKEYIFPPQLIEMKISWDFIFPGIPDYFVLETCVHWARPQDSSLAFTARCRQCGTVLNLLITQIRILSLHSHSVKSTKNMMISYFNFMILHI